MSSKKLQSKKAPQIKGKKGLERAIDLAGGSRNAFAKSIGVTINAITYCLQNGVTPGVALNTNKKYGIPMSELGHAMNCPHCGGKQ